MQLFRLFRPGRTLDIDNLYIDSPEINNYYSSLKFIMCCYSVCVCVGGGGGGGGLKNVPGSLLPAVETL